MNAIEEKYNQLTNRQSIEDVVEDGLFEFWKVIANKYPEATGGDLDIGMCIDISILMERAVKQWLDLNHPVGQEFGNQ